MFYNRKITTKQELNEINTSMKHNIKQCIKNIIKSTKKNTNNNKIKKKDTNMLIE